jgi:signal transduction histidine kinase
MEQAIERAPGRRIRLEVKGPAGECVADRRLLGMVLDELLENALRHTPLESEVCVTVEADPDRVSFSVEDGGPGVPNEVLERLFEPFFLTDFARTRGHGPGLGLTTVMAVTGLHGGSVTAAQSSLGGLKVTVSIPRTPPA